MLSGKQIALICVVAVLVLAMGFTLGRMGGSDINKTVLERKPVTPIAGDVLTMADWANDYPLQYNSYMLTETSGPKPGNFGGNILFQHSEYQPEMLTNFKGFGFGIDYNDDRGHYWAVIDNKETKRVNPGTKGACTTCKTPYVGVWYDRYGWEYANMSFWELYEEVPEEEPGVGCYMCHDPETMDLRIIQPALLDAGRYLGVDFQKAPVEDMRTYVCAQCHVTYYMDPESFKVIFPWTESVSATRQPGAAEPNLTVENIWKHYERVRGETGIDKFFLSDYKQADSTVDVVKVRHPEFETWSMGVHGKANVACADCHMPYQMEKGEKFSSHWMTSPLRTIDRSCGRCHDKSDEWLLDRVMQIQDNTFQAQRLAGTKIAEAHDAIAAAAETPGVNEAKLAEARELNRKAQFYWDYVAAENSMGFHAPDQIIRTLTQSVQYANDAVIAAYQAGGRLR